MDTVSMFPSVIVLQFVRSVKGLVGFDKLVELVLDNNNLGDDIDFPAMEKLETLTVNKNNVSFTGIWWLFFLQHVVKNENS